MAEQKQLSKKPNSLKPRPKLTRKPIRKLIRIDSKQLDLKRTESSMSGGLLYHILMNANGMLLRTNK